MRQAKIDSSKRKRQEAYEQRRNMTQQISVDSVMCQLQALTENQTALFQAIQNLSERSQPTSDPFLTFKTPDSVKNLPTFSGKRREAMAFIAEVDRVLSLFTGYIGTPTYTQIVWAVKSKIILDAKEVLIASGNPSEWEDIKQVLQNTYGDKRDLTSHLQSLFYVKQGNKSLQEYFNKVRSIDTAIKSFAASSPDYSDSTRAINKLISLITLTRYVDGLDENLSMYVRSHEPESLEHAYNITMQYNNFMFRKRLEHNSDFDKKNIAHNNGHKPQRNIYKTNTPQGHSKPNNVIYQQHNKVQHDTPMQPSTSGKFRTNKQPDGDASMRTARSRNQVNSHEVVRQEFAERDDTALNSEDDDLFGEINFQTAAANRQMK